MTTLEKGEEQAGISRALSSIWRCQPRVVCFIGKIALTTFGGRAQNDWGWQKEIEGTRVYLMHFPIRGPATVRVRESMTIERAAEGIV